MIGIDLGTTNSAIAVWRDGRPQLIPNSLGQVLTPSAVSVDDDGQLLVGMAARERQVTHPYLTATAFKRYMGTNRVTRLGEREFLPEELSALVLARVKADAEHYLKESVNSAIITVPAYFIGRIANDCRYGACCGLVGWRFAASIGFQYGAGHRDGTPTAPRGLRSTIEARPSVDGWHSPGVSVCDLVCQREQGLYAYCTIGDTTSRELFANWRRNCNCLLSVPGSNSHSGAGERRSVTGTPSSLLRPRVPRTAGNTRSGAPWKRGIWVACPTQLLWH
jgi:hypothetical protein